MNTKTLRNGAVYDMDTKRIVKGAVWSSAEASNMAKSRHEQAAETVRQRIMENMQSFSPNPVTTPIEAYAEIVSRQAQALYDSDKPRLDDTQTLGQIMGMLPKRGEITPTTDNVDALTDLVRELTRFAGTMTKPTDTYTNVIEGKAE